MCTKSPYLEGIFPIFFTSEEAHPPQTPPFEGCIQVTGFFFYACQDFYNGINRIYGIIDVYTMMGFIITNIP